MATKALKRKNSVARKIRKLKAEGKPHGQAVAIAIKHKKRTK